MAETLRHSRSLEHARRDVVTEQVTDIEPEAEIGTALDLVDVG